MFIADQSELARMGAMASNPSTGIHEIIMHPSIFVALRMNESTVIGYLCNNIENVLKLAFNDVYSASSTSSFEILLLMIPEIAYAMIEKGVFYNFANKLLSFPLQDSVVGRLSNLTFKLLESNYPGSLDSCGFLFKLLKYCGNSSVTDLFVSIMEDRPELEVIQRWLANRNIVQSIMKEIKDIEISKIDNDDFMSEPTEKLGAFFEMIESGIYNTILNYPFICNDVIECLSNQRMFVCFTEDQRWRAIIALALCKPLKSNHNMKPLIELAKRFIYNDFQRAHQFYGLIIDFLKYTLPESIDDEMITKLVRLIYKFPECSLLHVSVTAFITKALNMKLVDEIDMKFVANQVYKQATATRPGTSVRATTMYLMIVCTDYGKKHKKMRKLFEKIDGFSLYSKGELKNYRKSLEADYGKAQKKFFQFGNKS